MEYVYAIHALLAKRAELSGQIIDAQQRIRELTIDRDHVDAAIRVLKPDIDLSNAKVKPVPPPYGAFRGGLLRSVLDILRTADEPLSAREITKRVVTARGLDPDDTRLMRVAIRRVSTTLQKQRQRGRVESQPGPGQLKLWTVVKQVS